MIRATQVVGAAASRDSTTDTVVLDFDERHRRRIVMTGVRGLVFLLDLPEAVMLRSGDALMLEDGRQVEVLAAPEVLVEVRAAVPRDLVRLAWHLGNRHVPVEVLGKALRIRRDPVIEAMLAGLGARLRPIEAPFDPEGGAYAAGDRDANHHHHHGPGDGAHAH